MKTVWYPRLTYILVHLFFWGTFIAIFSPAPLGQGLFNLTLFRADDTLWFFLYGTFLNAVMFYSYVHLVLPKYLASGNVFYLIISNVLFLLAFVLMESGMDFYYMKMVYQVGNYDRAWSSFGEWMKTNLVFTGILMLVANFYGFTYGWFEGRRKQQDLEQAKLKAELLALKHQVNPHFLFNVLNSLYGLAFKNDDEPTAEGIAKLSQLMRYMLYDSNTSQVLLDREVTYIEDYIDLQRLRLPKQVEIDYQVQGSLKSQKIAPMMLIPFVENAFKHGLSTIRSSVILIHLFVSPKQLHMRVSNSVHPGSKAQTEGAPGGIGLQNVQQRLEMLYPNRHQLDIEQMNAKYEVNLRIDL